MVQISKKEQFKNENLSNSKEENKKESQYLLRVVYNTEDENVHKLLEGIFGPDQMLDVKNGKIAKINSELTPKQRDCFLGMISEALNKAEDNDKKESEPEEEIFIDVDNTIEKDEVNDINNKDGSGQEDCIHEEKNEQNSKKVNAEKLIKEFANFLNNIS